MQRQVFPKGRPADTAGFSDEPAATQSSVVTLDQRLDALERQMADLLRQSEENGNRLQTLEADLAKARPTRTSARRLEQRISEAAAAAAATVADRRDSADRRRLPRQSRRRSQADSRSSDGDGPAAAPRRPRRPPIPARTPTAEGFHLWEAGQYDQAITSLRAFTAAYPKHRRVSYANNLIGRALLDKGDARGAADALLANYRSNPAASARRTASIISARR